MDLMEFGKQFGFPALCLTALGVAIWRILAWAAVRGDRVLERHILFIDAVQRVTAEQALQQAAHAAALHKQTKILEEQTAILKGIRASSAVQSRIMVEGQRQGGNSREGL